MAFGWDLMLMGSQNIYLKEQLKRYMPVHSKSFIVFSTVVPFTQYANKPISVLIIVNAELGSIYIKFDSSLC